MTNNLHLVGIGSFGAMLSPSAGHLKEHGPAQYVRVLDRGTQSAEHHVRRQAWEKHGAKLVPTIEALVKPANFDGVVICAGKNGSDHAIITEVVRYLKDCGSEKFILHLSTVSADFAEKAAAFCAAHGLKYADYPLTGGSAGATAGTMLILASGQRSLFDYLEPMLSTIGKPRFCGEGVADGAKVKLIGHYMVFNGLSAIASAVALQAACFENGSIGEHQLDFFKFLNGGAGGTKQFDVALMKGLTGDWSTGFKMDHAAPDCLYAAQLGFKSGLPAYSLVPLLNTAVTFGHVMKCLPHERYATQALVNYLVGDPAKGLNAYFTHVSHLETIINDFPKALDRAAQSLPRVVRDTVMLDVPDFKL